MSNTTWLIIALVVVIASIGIYTATLVTRRKKLEERLERLARSGH